MPRKSIESNTLKLRGRITKEKLKTLQKEKSTKRAQLMMPQLTENMNRAIREWSSYQIIYTDNADFLRRFVPHRWLKRQSLKFGP